MLLKCDRPETLAGRGPLASSVEEAPPRGPKPIRRSVVRLLLRIAGAAYRLEPLRSIGSYQIPHYPVAVQPPQERG